MQIEVQTDRLSRFCRHVKHRIGMPALTVGNQGKAICAISTCTTQRCSVAPSSSKSFIDFPKV